MDSDVPDELLMAQVVTGDMTALGTLFERYKQPLFNFLFRFMHNQAWAEDVALDTFLRVYERRTSFQAKAKFSTWLYTIAHNIAVDQLKHQAHQHTYVARRGMEMQQASTERDASPFERYTTSSMVRDAVSALPDDQRAVIILREYQGLSYREIAAIIGGNEETIRVRVHRARQALKQALSPLLREESKLCQR